MTSSVRYATYLAGKNPIGGAQKENSVAPNWNYGKPAALPDISTRKPRGRESYILGPNCCHIQLCIGESLYNKLISPKRYN